MRGGARVQAEGRRGHVEAEAGVRAGEEQRGGVGEVGVERAPLQPSDAERGQATEHAEREHGGGRRVRRVPAQRGRAA